MSVTQVIHPPTHPSQQGTTGAASINEQLNQLRPKRALYGADRKLRPYELLDAEAQLLLTRAKASMEGGGGRRKGKGKGGGGGGVVVGQEDFYQDFADLGTGVGIILLSTARIIFMDEEGNTRETLLLRDVLFVEVAVATASTERNGVVLHMYVKEERTRRFLVPCETVGHARTFKYKVDQALLSFRTSGVGGGR